MKLLFITPQLPYPPQKGTTTRNFNIIKNLSRNHEVHLLSFGDSRCRDHVEALEAYCASVKLCAMPTRRMATRVRDLFLNPRPDLVLRLASPEFVERLREILLRNRFDVLQIEGLEMCLHWDTVSKENRARSAVRATVLDDHNAEYVLQRRAFEIDRGRPRKLVAAMYSFVQWRRLTRYEAEMCRRVDGVVTVSEIDRKALDAISRLPRVAVVPNGVDVDYFRLAEPEGKHDAPTLLFSGTMDFRPNIDAVTWFCEEILPRVHRDVPEAKFCIVGRDPLPAVTELGKDPRVVVTGFVEDVRPYFRQASVYVVPLRFGGGTRFKVLEAMAAGIPVVSTAMGAEGIEASSGRDLIVADDPGSFAQWVVRLLREEDRRRHLVESARAIIERKYDWRIIVPRLEELYTRIA
ncbi:MAG: glycosyltransferase [Chloroflexi bacterium]|nr:glycosyltransferase [Chloroflexota bacterium]